MYHKTGKTKMWHAFYDHNDSPYINNSHRQMVMFMILGTALVLGLAAAMHFAPALGLAKLAPFALVGMAAASDGDGEDPPATDPAELKNLGEKLEKGMHDFKEVLAQRDADVKKHGKALGDTTEKLNKHNEHLDQLEAEYKKNQERLDQFEARLNSPGGQGSGSETEKLARRHNAALIEFLSKGDESNLRKLQSEKLEGLNIFDEAKGGAMLPRKMWGNIIDAATPVTPALQLAFVQNSGAAGMDFVRENTTPTATEDSMQPTEDVDEGDVDFKLESINKKTLSILLVIPNSLLKYGSLVSIENWLVNKSRMKISKKVGSLFVNGVGAPGSAWEGIMVNSSIAHIASGDASALKFGTGKTTGLLAWVYSLPAQFAVNANILCSRATKGIIRGLETTAGQLIYSFDFKTGSPTVEGVPIVESEDMPAVSGSNFPAIIGDFKTGYQIDMEETPRVTRLVETYARKNCTGVLIQCDAAGAVVQPDAFRKLEIAAS